VEQECAARLLDEMKFALLDTMVRRCRRRSSLQSLEQNDEKLLGKALSKQTLSTNGHQMMVVVVLDHESRIWWSATSTCIC
jgi:hypothetical protein